MMKAKQVISMGEKIQMIAIVASAGIVVHGIFAIISTVLLLVWIELMPFSTEVEIIFTMWFLYYSADTDKEIRDIWRK